MNLEIRELTNNDVFALLDIVVKISEKAQKDIAVVAKSGDVQKVGKTVLSILLSGDTREDIKAWCGNLYEISGTEFGNLPLSVTATLIKSLREQEGLRDFLSQVSALIPASLKAAFKSLGNKS
jgi:hypothetical protein